MAILSLLFSRARARLWLGPLLCAALSACMSERPPLGLPDASVMSFDGTHAHGPNCASIAIPSYMSDPDGIEHPTIPFGCATYQNLAAQLARPADATQPKPFAGADGIAAERAVERYRNPSTTHGESQSQDGGSAATSGSTTTSTSQ